MTDIDSSFTGGARGAGGGGAYSGQATVVAVPQLQAAVVPHQRLPEVDSNFNESHPKLDRGVVPVLHGVDEANLDQHINERVSKPTCFSECARSSCVAFSLLTVVGAIAVCTKMKMVKPDEIGLARGFDGNVCVLLSLFVALRLLLPSLPQGTGGDGHSFNSPASSCPPRCGNITSPRPLRTHTHARTHARTHTLIISHTRANPHTTTKGTSCARAATCTRLFSARSRSST
jgi:hypothetical protein